MSKYETSLPIAVPEEMADEDCDKAAALTHEILVAVFQKIGFKPGARRDSVAQWQAVAGREAGLALATNIYVNSLGAGSAKEAAEMAQRFGDAARAALDAVREQLIRERAERN